MNAHRLGAPVLALASHIASRQIGSGYWLCDAASEVLAHDGPALLDVVTTPDALDVPSHITAEQVRGFALALGKIVLGGGVGEVANLAPLNVRNIPRPYRWRRGHGCRRTPPAQRILAALGSAGHRG